MLKLSGKISKNFFMVQKFLKNATVLVLHEWGRVIHKKKLCETNENAETINGRKKHFFYSISNIWAKYRFFILWNFSSVGNFFCSILLHKEGWIETEISYPFFIVVEWFEWESIMKAEIFYHIVSMLPLSASLSSPSFLWFSRTFQFNENGQYYKVNFFIRKFYISLNILTHINRWKV